MGLARALCVALNGIDGQLIEVEADISQGLPIVTVTGLGDKSVSEARDRIHAAVVNSGAVWPRHRVTIALLPADVRKIGSRFDLAMALAVLAAAGHVPAADVAGIAWLGELGLDGRLRRTRGILPAAAAAQRAGVTRIVVPLANAAEAALIDGLEVRGARSLRDVLGWLRGDAPAPPIAQTLPDGPSPEPPDLADVLGQGAARRRWRSRQRAVITSPWRGFRARARQCSPSVCLDCCRSSTTRRRLS